MSGANKQGVVLRTKKQAQVKAKQSHKARIINKKAYRERQNTRPKPFYGHDKHIQLSQGEPEMKKKEHKCSLTRTSEVHSLKMRESQVPGLIFNIPSCRGI